MNRTLSKLALGISLVLLALPSDVLAGRGGGGRGGGRVAAVTAAGGGGGHGGGGTRPHSASRIADERVGFLRQPLADPAVRPGLPTRSHAVAAARVPAAAATRATLRATRARRSTLTATAGAAAAAGAGYANRNQGCAVPQRGRRCRRRRRLRQPQPGPRSTPTRVPVPPPAQATPITMNGYLERQQLCGLGGNGIGHGLRERGRGLGRRLADVRLGLFGL